MKFTVHDLEIMCLNPGLVALGVCLFCILKYAVNLDMPDKKNETLASLDTDEAYIVFLVMSY